MIDNVTLQDYMTMQIENNLWRRAFFHIYSSINASTVGFSNLTICFILSDVDLSAINGKLVILFLHVFFYLYDLKICTYIMIEKIQN
jgi:hypothetical protein